MSYVSICLCSKLAGLPGLPATPCSCTLDLPVDFLSFGNRETTNTSRLGAAKVPQPSIDLIYMAASACSYSLARSVCTAKFKVWTLTCCILVWNGGGGVAIKEAWKEWHPTKNVLNPANVESRYRGTRPCCW